MASEMVKRVALAIESAPASDYEALAKAAIAAMREATPLMIMNFDKRDSPLANWKYGIDAALKE